MENFLPALLIIGGVIYKIYSEYKKDQEKARHRNPSRPIKTTPPSPPKRIVPPTLKPTTVQLPNVEEEITQKYTKKRFQTESPKRKLQEIPKKVEPEISADEAYSFDLRQAVIQSAILDRPYK
ncbi:MAG: hypothetical protein ACTJHT_02025 [Sphingobacterium sp.]|uniref:hypothetical protein n=1 Tax=Sphingobacterium sp. JB170 TaxID=1434842 RepID=UPI000B34E1CF|nr:hypothetical protein [Sphingobacterium sp. JB170]